MDADQKLKEFADQWADAMIVLMKMAREEEGEPLEAMRPIIVEQVKTRMAPMLSSLDTQMNGLVDGVLEAAAKMLSEFEALSGARAASLVRAMKEDLPHAKGKPPHRAKQVPR